MKSLLYSTILLTGLFLFSACENKVSMKTIVQEDGSLEKTIVLEKTGLHQAEENMFGINEQTGWATQATKIDSTEDKFRIEFKKNFASVDDVNRELDQDTDTLFRIHSTFEKQFRWFYTYIRYTETIRPINRFKLINTDDYFNQEDHAFIDRLPGEGTPISKADSVFLETLNEKITERFSDRAFYYEINEILNEVALRHNLDKKWLDTLKNNLDLASEIVESFKENKENTKLEQVVDSLVLGNPKAEKDLEALANELGNRRDFMGTVYYSSYKIETQLPWEISSSNADSVSGNTLIWRPLATKFAIKPYTMYAESRQVNLWAVVVSALVVGITVYLFVRKSKS
ncbi:MAG: hypothetical protein MUC73_06805 [Cyclobacteriaceae bacterium]|nr:hypothetical protein [Cyclobacteriaceae bacterium]